MWRIILSYNGKNTTNKSVFRFHYLINRNFQVKYTVYLVTSAFFSSLLVGGPTYYFLSQNYDIFLNLSYTLSPEIVQHLTQERNWITGFFIFSLLVLIIFHVYIGIRFTFRMAGPLVALKRHMNLVTKGHLYQKPLLIRQDDEFHDLIRNYNYLYKTLRAQNSFDIKKLETLKYHINDPKDLEIINEIISEKESQLNDPGISSAKPNHVSNHAS